MDILTAILIGILWLTFPIMVYLTIKLGTFAYLRAKVLHENFKKEDSSDG